MIRKEVLRLVAHGTPELLGIVRGCVRRGHGRREIVEAATGLCADGDLLFAELVQEALDIVCTESKHRNVAA